MKKKEEGVPLMGKTKEQKRNWLQVLTDFVEQKMAPPLLKVAQIRYLEALQNVFITMMPYMLLGAAATLILNLSGLFVEGSGLNMPAVANAIDAIVNPCRPWLLQIVFVSLNILALLAAILNGYFLGDYYHRRDENVSPIVGGIVAMASFFCFVDFSTFTENFDWPTYILGSPSLFGGIIISIMAVEIYRFLIGKKLVIKMPEAVPPMIGAAFTSMIPVSVVIIISAILGQGIAGFDFLALINAAMAKLVVGGSGPIAQGVGFFLDRLLWFVGIHGSNIVSSIMGPIWTNMITENINAFAAGQAIPYMFTEQWTNYYVRVSVFPIALLCCCSKVKRFKVLGKIALPGTIFNIAEPIMYGLPIVLNPLMFVPWVLGFTALWIFNAILAVIGLTPPVVAMTVWTMPVPLGAFIGTGFKFSAVLISLLSFVLLFLIFLPFFKVMEKQELAEEAKYEKESEA